MRIGENIPALQTANSIWKANQKISKSMTRLSSGFKINRSSDDPTGLAISNKMRRQISGLESANRNSMDGISLVQTADGALGGVHDMVQRMRELAIQAATDTVTDEDREKIQLEIDGLMAEINDVARKTSFNNNRLFSGNYASIGEISASTTINVISSDSTMPAGSFDFQIDSAGSLASFNIAPNITVPGGTYTVTFDGGVTTYSIDADDNLSFCEQVKSLAESLGYSTYLNPVLEEITIYSNENFPAGTGSSFTDTIGAATTPSISNVTYTDADGTTITLGAVPPGDPGPGLYANGNKIIFVIDGKELEFQMDIQPDGSGNFILGDGTLLTDVPAMANITLTEETVGNVILQVGAYKDMRMTIELPELSTDILELYDTSDPNGTGIPGIIEDLSYLNREVAQEAIRACDRAISILNTMRAQFGAYQNRLEYTVTGIETTSLNLSDALSRLADTDMAAEMTRYTSQSVVYQAGIAIMAQANQRPQQVLQLIG